MRVTIYDVAKKAGVGIGTVSRVINKSPQISPKTRKKVLGIIKELNYQPYVMAQGLARKKTNTVACIVPFFTGYFYFELLNGVQQALSKHNYDLILYSVDLFDKKEDIFERTLQERRVDGVLLFSMTISDDYADKFVNKKMPIALVDGYHKSLDSITIENKKGAYLAAEHLIKMGHSKLGLINGNLGSIPARIRLKGFNDALAANDITPDEQHIFNVSSIDDPQILSNDGFNKLAGYYGMSKLLDLGENRPTGVFISSDIQAAGAMKVVNERGLKIPEDIAIVSFDGIELSEYLGLSTMKQPMFEMGALAVELVIRDTCGAKLQMEKILD